MRRLARRFRSRLGLLLIGVAVLAAAFGISRAFGDEDVNVYAPPAPRTAAADLRTPAFSHAVLVVLENRPAAAILGSPNAPVLNRLARRYALLSNYYGVAHPSLPNYLALISGTTDGILHDCASCVVRAPTLADTLAEVGSTWKTYVEGVSRRGLSDVDVVDVKARIPFLYVANVIARDSEFDRIVPLRQFSSDLSRRQLPAFSLVVPSLCHDMHNCSVRTGDRWLGRFVGPLLRALGAHDVVFVVFDESYRSDKRFGGGHVAGLVLGRLVRPGSTARGHLNHYDLLRTIEDGLRLPLLGRSAGARAIPGIWRQPRLG